MKSHTIWDIEYMYCNEDEAVIELNISVTRSTEKDNYFLNHHHHHIMKTLYLCIPFIFKFQKIKCIYAALDHVQWKVEKEHLINCIQIFHFEQLICDYARWYTVVEKSLWYFCFALLLPQILVDFQNQGQTRPKASGSSSRFQTGTK